MQHQESIEIEAPIEGVWATIADVERWSEWTASVTSIERLDDGDFGVGSKAKVRQPRLPTAVWTVTELEPGRSFTWRNASPGMTTVATHTATDLGNGRTKAELSIVQSGLLAGVVAVFTGGLTRRYVRTEAEGLKRRCESGGATG